MVMSISININMNSNMDKYIDTETDIATWSRDLFDWILEEPGDFKLAAMDALGNRCSRNRMIVNWQRWMHFGSDARRTG